MLQLLIEYGQSKVSQVQTQLEAAMKHANNPMVDDNLLPDNFSVCKILFLIADTGVY